MELCMERQQRLQIKLLLPKNPEFKRENNKCVPKHTSLYKEKKWRVLRGQGITDKLEVEKRWSQPEKTSENRYTWNKHLDIRYNMLSWKLFQKKEVALGFKGHSEARKAYC